MDLFASPSQQNRTFTLNFMGDAMLGRLIDQLFPDHVDEPSEAAIIQKFLLKRPDLADFRPARLWGNLLPLLHQADLNLVNLETSVTTQSQRWPNKAFSYRMHPANLRLLRHARIHYVGLANNHTLDFGLSGLAETVRSVKAARLNFAGAGETWDEARRPAVLRLQGRHGNHEVHVWAAADHPAEWATAETFHAIDYSQRSRDRLKALLLAGSSSSSSAWSSPLSSSSSTSTSTMGHQHGGGNRPALKVFSVHWGPNYAWEPADEIRDLAHFLVDECGVDIVHGHSAHHVQGVEQYRGKLILYGCGDLIDDYGLTPEYRNDVSGIWRISVEEGAAPGDGLMLKRLEVFPTKIEKFMVRRLYGYEEDSEWVRNKIRDLSSRLGTHAKVEHGGEGRLTVELSS